MARVVHEPFWISSSGADKSVGLVVCGSIPEVNPSIVSPDFALGLSKAMLKCWQGRASSKLRGGFG